MVSLKFKGKMRNELILVKKAVIIPENGDIIVQQQKKYLMAKIDKMQPLIQNAELGILPSRGSDSNKRAVTSSMQRRAQSRPQPDSKSLPISTRKPFMNEMSKTTKKGY